MQIKLEMVDEDHTIEVPNNADFLTAFQAITTAMRDECIYENSSGLYRHKKMHTHTCEWCGKKFETMQKVGKFCCRAHKMKAHRLLIVMKNRKRLTDIARKGKDFRLHFGDIAEVRRKR